jgi:hypothetical protein
MDDITALILDDHHRFRVGFARLDDAQSPEDLEAIWTPLALHLDIHADAEEEILYPHLLKDAGGDDAEEETDEHPQGKGLSFADKDPAKYIEKNS